ncbi:MAG: hypothetical protein KJZ98_17610, partial [Burkholderiaceae bacterium]|nr:hypothetical protein [Burkholderiaceae bacterium]
AVLEPLRIVEAAAASEAARQPAGGARVGLRIDDVGEVEAILATLREAGCRVEEMELAHTDLEDVFVRVMKETR